MSRFPMDLSHFKKVSEDKHFTTLKHKDGHEMKIASKALSPKMRGQMKAIPMAEASGKKDAPGKASKEPMKMADGGMVPSNKLDIEEIPTEQTPTDAMAIKTPEEPKRPALTIPDSFLRKEQNDFANLPPEQPLYGMSNTAEPQTRTENAPMSLGQTPSENTAPPVVAPQGPQDPYGTEAHLQNMAQGIEERKAGMLLQAQAESKLAQSQAVLAERAAKQQEALVSDYQKNVNSLNTERQSLMADIKNSHIDPNRFMGSQGTGERISTAIGLIMSGFGSGMAGQENMAMKFLNQQIDRDIDAQKQDLGKKESLLNANFKQFGNMHDAMTMTRVMQKDILADRLQAEAAKVGDMQAKARLLQASGQLQQEIAPMMGQLAMRRTLTSSTNVAPETKIRMLVPQGEQEPVYKELHEAQGMVKARDNLMGAFDKVEKLQSIGNRVSNPIQSKRQIASITGPVIAGLSKETAGRFTEQDAAMIEPLMPHLGDDAETLATKRTQLSHMVNEKMNFPRLKAWGIDMNATGRFDSRGASRITESKPVIK